MPETRSASRSTKRAKITPSRLSEDEDNDEKNDIVPKKMNRLQRSVTRNKSYLKGHNVTAAQLKRIKKAEKQAGILAALMDAPVEIFYEIAHYLSPLDLLSLSRVSRQLHNLILSKQSINLWKACMPSIDLPPCPDDLNEPQYISLVFDTDCNACGAPNIKYVYYELRVRLCDKCFRLNVIAGSQLVSRLKNGRSFKSLASGNTDVYKLIPHAGQINMKDFKDAGLNSSLKDKKFYKPDFIDAVKEYTNLKTSDDSSNFVKQQLNRIIRILKHSELMRKWEEQKAYQRKTELTDLASLFFRAVKSKLRELGYTDDDWVFNGLWHEDASKYITQWRKLTLQKKELTPRVWKNLAPKLEELIENYKSDVEEKHRQERFRTRKEEFKRFYGWHISSLNLTFGEKVFIPHEIDIVETKAVDDFIRHDDSYRVITSEVFSSFLHILEQLFYENKLQVIAEHENAVFNWRKENNRKIPNIGNSKHIYLASSLFSDAIYHGRGNFYYFNSKFPVMLGDIPSGSRATDGSRHLKQYLLKLSDGLLCNLGLPLNTTLDAITEMGDCFVCCQCDVTLQRPMDWVNLIKHIIREVEKGIIVQARTRPQKGKDDETRHDKSHSLDNYDNLVRKLDEKEYEAFQDKRRLQSMTIAEVKAHIKSAHRKEASDGDIL